MKKIDFRKQKIPFTQVANVVLNDNRLSAKAKGVYAYLYSKPDGWDFETTRMSKDFKDGRDSVRSAIKELEKVGYLKRYKTPIGRMVYAINVEPMTENQSQEPMTEKANDGKRHSGKISHISNKEGEVIKSISNKDCEQSSRANLIVEIITSFIEVDPKNKIFYGNKTQRSAADFLIEEYGFEEVKKRISFLPKSNKMPYFPTITTPCQLRDKWVQLEDAVARVKNENKVAF